MTCDFKLTDARTSKEISVDTHKLVSVHRPAFQALVGATGLARLGRQGAADWVAEATGDLPHDATLDDLLNALKRVSEALDNVPLAIHRFRRLSLVVGAIQGSQSVIALVSNFQSFRGTFLSPGETPSAEMQVDVIRPSKPMLRVAGEVAAIRKEDRKAAEAMLRAGLEGAVIRKRLAGLNKRAAARVVTVSEGCYAASQYATGNGAAEPHLVEQTGDFIPLEVKRMFDQIGMQLRPAVRPDGTTAPIQMRGSTSVNYAPSQSFFREQFKLRPDDSELWNNYGAYEDSEGRAESARRAFEKALSLKPDNYFAARNLGNILWRRFGERVRAQENFEIALRESDQNHRRDTLSLYAENLAMEGDLDAASRYFGEAMAGEVLPVVATRYAAFLLDHRPQAHGDAVRAVKDVLEKEPNYVRAVVVDAYCRLRQGEPAASAAGDLLALAARFPQDADLMINAACFSLYADDCHAAEKYFKRLRRVKNVSAEVIHALGGILMLCRAGPVAEVVDEFEAADGVACVMNRALLAWAGGDGDRARSLLGEVAAEGLPASYRVEAHILSMLIEGAEVGNVIQDSRSRFDGYSLRAFDPTVMVLASRHPDIPIENREKLADLVDKLHASCEPFPG
ncbi:tetratricopeptide repeat protein [Pseudonocardia sp. WMMC193]|uniref:tetratricopeptide repeat protein n=1 Tax=Pseudonocardia sp. WMMC193 TaxID=2911965 RepID=UPI001F2BC052|nr:tetratricopeptide repeat protein [Pseudonocardia sp. WMMC193]MCF7551473.1 tetratricopeptide repeat protein [Pseudonocardia sp. WMMC193]